VTTITRRICGLVLLFAALAIAGCSTGVQPIRRPTTEPSLTPLPTFTPRPTATDVPTLPVLSLLPDVTSTATPNPQARNASWAGRVKGLQVVYGGPGVAYGEVARLGDRTPVDILGRSKDSNWLLIQMPVDGWLKASQVIFVDATTVLSSLQIIPAPPLPTATRRPPPVDLPTTVPTNTPLPSRSFTVSPSVIQAGQCTVITWSVSNIQALYLNGNGVNGSGSETDCPSVATTYQLHVVHVDGSAEDLWQTVSVSTPPVQQIILPTIVININFPTRVSTQTPVVVTATPTWTATFTPTPTWTASPTYTPSPTLTRTPTVVVAPSVTPTNPVVPPPINLPTVTPAH
jgi:hypothetical protein